MFEGESEATRTKAERALPPLSRLGRSIDLVAGLRAPEGRAALRLWAGEAGARLADTVRHELDAGLALPGLVVLFACGIVGYFLLPREPWPPAVIGLAAILIAVTALWRRSGHPARIAASLAALALGVAAASVETLRVAAPRLDHERTVTVEGRVVDVDATARGGLRLTVDVARMEGRGLTPATTPRRITATVTARGWRPDVGDGVRFKARLKPPEGPVMPGGYDFARRAWFEGRGAGGYVLGRVTPLDLGGEGWSDRAIRAIGSLRHAIAERVRASLPGATGAIGAALIVGEQRAIPEEAAEPLRASGLTHIVSISGLHMGLVAGGVIVAVRAMLALFPLLALGFPIKKWAAVAAFGAATVYLLLSGMQVAALRSHLMLSVALLAVMVDRPAITMHTVAVSAALILAVTPSSVMEPSFQMSYLAVIALVASYDLYRVWASRRRPPARDAGLVGHLVGASARQIEGFAFSSLVAGLATAPVIAGVFFRAAPYSILANMAVLPVTGLVVMPAAVVAALAMPFGLDHGPLVVMGFGIDWMIAVGRWAAALPGGAGVVGEPHAAMMPLGIAAVLWLSAWKSRLRLLGIVPGLMALGLVFAGPRPDVMIGRHGAPVAVRGVDGRLHVLGGRQERFDTAIWLAADADPRAADDRTLGEGWRCDALGCVFALPAGAAGPRGAGEVGGAGGRGRADEPAGPGGRDGASDAAGSVGVGEVAGWSARSSPAGPRARETSVLSEAAARLEVAVVRHPDGFAEDCRRAALVVTTLIAPPGCRDHTTVVDRLDLARTGAASLDFVGLAEAKRVGTSRDGPHDVRSPGLGSPSRRPPGAPVVDPTQETDDGPPGGAAPEARRTVAGTTAGRTAATEGKDSTGGRTSTDRKGTTGGRTITDRKGTTGGRTVTDREATVDGTFAAERGGTANMTTAAPGADAVETVDLDPLDPPTLTRALRLTASLPASPRPWTPRDPRIERMVQDAEDAEALARAAAEAADATEAADPPPSSDQ